MEKDVQTDSYFTEQNKFRPHLYNVPFVSILPNANTHTNSLTKTGAFTIYIKLAIEKVDVEATRLSIKERNHKISTKN